MATFRSIGSRNVCSHADVQVAFDVVPLSAQHTWRVTVVRAA